MAIELSCDGCGQAYRVGDEHAGRRFRCKKCDLMMTIPGGDAFDDWGREGLQSFAPPRAKSSGKAKRRRSEKFEDGFLGFNWYLAAWKNFNDLSGRARRKEYWMFICGSALITIGLSILENFTVGLILNGRSSLLATIYSVVAMAPAFSALIRRLHDTGRSGWWVLIGVVPILGTLILFIFAIRDSQPGKNQWGPNPKR